MTTRRAIIAAALVVALAAAAVGLRQLLHARAQAAVTDARASLFRCVLGAPLGAGETPSTRVHRITLGTPPADWPSRCDPYLAELGKALGKAGRDLDAADLRVHWPSGLRSAEIELTPWNVDALWPSLPLGLDPNPTVPAAPAPLEALDERTPKLLPKGTLDGWSTDPLPALGARIVFSSGTLCEFAASLDAATCSDLSKRAPQGFQGYSLWPRTDYGAPALITDFVEKEGRVQRFFRADNGTLFDTRNMERAVWAYGYADGSFVTLGPPEDEQRDGFELVLWRGREHGKPLRLDLDARRVALFGDRLIWVSRPEDTDHLMSAALSREPLGLGKPQDLGEIEVDPASFEACRTKDALALVMLRGARYRVLFFRDGVQVAEQIAKLPSDARISSRALSCGADDVHIARVVARARKKSELDTTGYIVQHARCTVSGCEVRELDLDKVLADEPDAARPAGMRERDVAAGGLDGKLLVVWRSRERGVRARLAAPDALATAKDFLLYDDRIENGAVARDGTVTSLAVVPRRDAALVLLTLRGDHGIAALRVGNDGKVAAIAAK